MANRSVAVVGRGLIGSAAARHLANAGYTPVLIGPDEPKDKRRHQGVFASHYDEGRITRKNATKSYWAKASIASIARYSEIEEASGIRFYNPVGALMTGSRSGPFMQDATAVSRECEIECEFLNREALATEFPDLSVPDDWEALWEPAEAGHISPRNLVAAQTAAAEGAGCQVIRHPVTGIEDTGSGVRLSVNDEVLNFDFVLVAAGGMTDHVLSRPNAFHVYGRTIALFELDEEDGARLGYLPSMVINTSVGHYFLPPIRYPDGKLYMKLGGEREDLDLPTAKDIGDFYRSRGRADVRDALAEEFGRLFPNVSPISTRMDACVTTFSDDELPEIRRLSPNLAVAAAGNGAGAKCSDELGRRGAALVMPETGPDDV